MTRSHLAKKKSLNRAVSQFPQHESRGQDPRVVEDQKIAGAEQIGQIAEEVMSDNL